MKKSFAEKSSIQIFLGAVVIVTSAVLFLNSCKQENEKIISKSDNSNIRPEAKKTNPAKLTEEEEQPTSDKRIIYLTLDDGPKRGTKNLLKIIHERNIPITSFVVGKHINDSHLQEKEYKLLENDSLIELANHSYSHANNQYLKFYKNSEMVVADFNRAKDSLRIKNNYARTPGRNIWRTAHINATDIKTSKNAADTLAEVGYKLIGWDLEWKPDTKMTLKGNHQEMVKKVDSIFMNDLEKTPRHLVFLTHDQYLADDNSANELNLFIQKLQESNKFEFRKISDYPKINEILN